MEVHGLMQVRRLEIVIVNRMILSLSQASNTPNHSSVQSSAVADVGPLVFATDSGLGNIGGSLHSAFVEDDAPWVMLHTEAMLQPEPILIGCATGSRLKTDTV